jgi:hypothetical protein
VGNFTGQITDLNIWNVPLSHEDIETYALKCNQNLQEERKVINWEKLKDFKMGNLTRIVNITRTDTCFVDGGKIYFNYLVEFQMLSRM